MTSLILVTGGTGVLGRHVIPRLREAGHDIRVLSRQSHVSGAGTRIVIEAASQSFIDARVP